MPDMSLLYNQAYQVADESYPLIDYVSYVTEKGMSFTGARKLLMINLNDMKKNYANEETRTYVMPNHSAAKALYELRITQYERQLSIMKILEEEENKINKIITSELKNEPLAILNEMETPKEKKPDYTRGVIIGGIVFTGLMLLLIWRIRK